MSAPGISLAFAPGPRHPKGSWSLFSRRRTSAPIVQGGVVRRVHEGVGADGANSRCQPRCLPGVRLPVELQARSWPQPSLSAVITGNRSASVARGGRLTPGGGVSVNR